MEWKNVYDWIPGVPDEDTVMGAKEKLRLLAEALRQRNGGGPATNRVATRNPVDSRPLFSGTSFMPPAPRSSARLPGPPQGYTGRGGEDPSTYNKSYPASIEFDPSAMFPDIPDFGGGLGSSGMDLYNAQYGQNDADKAALQSRYDQGDDKLEAMYGALSRKISEEAGGISANYDAGTLAANTASDAGNASVTKVYDDNAGRNQAMMQAMGIQQAAPNVQTGAADDSARLNGIIDANQVATTNQLTTGKAAALAQNTGLAGLAGLEGNESRDALLNQFMEQMAGLQGERGQIDQARLSAEAESNDPWKRYDAQWDQFTFANDAIAKQESELREQQNFDTTQAGKAGGDAAEAPDFDRIYTTASSMLGPEKGKEAMDRIARASMTAGSMEDIGTFLAAVGQGNRDRAIPYDLLRSLATQYYQSFS